MLKLNRTLGMVFLGLMGASFANILYSKHKNKLTEKQIQYISYEVSRCSYVQNLIQDGYSKKEIMEKIIPSLNPSTFQTLTGKRWPS